MKENLKILVIDEETLGHVGLKSINEFRFAMPNLNAGARGYLFKIEDQQTMVLAIDTVLEGKHLFCSDALNKQLYNDFFSGYLNGNRMKVFVTREGLVGYKVGRKKDSCETTKKGSKRMKSSPKELERDVN